MNAYDEGRLNLPFVGLVTFGKWQSGQDTVPAGTDYAILGLPYDMGCQYRSGSRFGPRSVREASTLYSFGHAGVYDHEDDVVYLEPGAAKIVDMGDADIVHTDSPQSLKNIEMSCQQILQAGAIPVCIGGDHSVTSACVAAQKENGPLHVVQIDAHLDFVDERHGVRYGHGNPMRRASEMDHVTGITHLGIRGVSSSNKQDYNDARASGSTIHSVRQIREMGAKSALANIPEGARVYVTIDIDAFCPSIAPGTGTPSPGGFQYYEVKDLLKELAGRTNFVGFDLVEVAPDYDATGSTSFHAARVIMDALAYMIHFDHHIKQP